jgi:hypothetical protein
MQEDLPTLRALYPDATSDAVLRGFRPPRTGIPARSWARFVWGLAGNALVLLVLIVPLDRIAPENTEATATLIYTLSGMAAIAYVLLRIALKPPWRRDRRVTWQQWAADRGLRASAPGALKGRSSFEMLTNGLDRTWQGPFVGRVGSHEMYIGAREWVTGFGGSSKCHHAFFVLVRIPQSVSRFFPSSSVTHFLRGFSNFELAISGRELRFESIDVDLNCEIRVGGGEDAHWWQLFDPTMVLALAESVDVQWAQQGQYMLFCAGGRKQSSAPTFTLDTMCAGAEYVARRYEHVAHQLAFGSGAGPAGRIAG